MSAATSRACAGPCCLAGLEQRIQELERENRRLRRKLKESELEVSHLESVRGYLKDDIVWLKAANRRLCARLGGRRSTDEVLEIRRKGNSSIRQDAPAVRIAAIDEFVRATGAKIIERGARAYYVPKRDEIRMPDFDRYLRADYFYSVLFHELAHWTEHKSRLNRDDDMWPRPRRVMAMGELIAEFAAAMLCEQFGLWPPAGHAEYIERFAKYFGQDRDKVIAEAKREARRSVEYLMACAENARGKAKRDVARPRLAGSSMRAA